MAQNVYQKLDLIELYDSYCALKKLEDNSAYFGNVEYVFSQFIDSDTLKFFEHCYDSRGN